MYYMYTIFVSYLYAIYNSSSSTHCCIYRIQIGHLYCIYYLQDYDNNYFHHIFLIHIGTNYWRNRVLKVAKSFSNKVMNYAIAKSSDFGRLMNDLGVKLDEDKGKTKIAKFNWFFLLLLGWLTRSFLPKCFL